MIEGPILGPTRDLSPPHNLQTTQIDRPGMVIGDLVNCNLTTDKNWMIREDKIICFSPVQIVFTK